MKFSKSLVLISVITSISVLAEVDSGTGESQAMFSILEWLMSWLSF